MSSIFCFVSFLTKDKFKFYFSKNINMLIMSDIFVVVVVESILNNIEVNHSKFGFIIVKKKLKKNRKKF